MGADCQRFKVQTERLRERLARPLPGPAALLQMAPASRRFVATDEARQRGATEAAALVLLFPDGPDLRTHCVLTVRSGELRNHPGQISFPGGRIDHGETITEAALREAWEELSVPGYALDVLGELTPVYISVTDYLVHPVVAAAARRPDFRPQEDEVADLIEVPVRRFVGEANRREDTWVLRGERRLVRYFEVSGHKVWGATAMMLSELAAVYADAVEEG